MINMDYMWLLFALLSAVFAALVAIFGKMGLEGIDSNTATVIRAGVMFGFLVIFILFTGKIENFTTIFSNSKAVNYIILSGIAGALSWLFYFFALKIGKASQVASIDRLSIVFVIILSVLVIGESINWKIALGAALMAVGAIIVALG
jgi:bacterial/archaeal transporter family protein